MDGIDFYESNPNVRVFRPTVSIKNLHPIPIKIRPPISCALERKPKPDFLPITIPSIASMSVTLPVIMMAALMERFGNIATEKPAANASMLVAKDMGSISLI